MRTLRECAANECMGISALTPRNNSEIRRDPLRNALKFSTEGQFGCHFHRSHKPAGTCWSEETRGKINQMSYCSSREAQWRRDFESRAKIGVHVVVDHEVLEVHCQSWSIKSCISYRTNYGGNIRGATVSKIERAGI